MAQQSVQLLRHNPVLSQNSKSLSDLVNFAAPNFMPPLLAPALLAPSLPPLADAPSLPLPLLPADDRPAVPAHRIACVIRQPSQYDVAVWET